MRLQSLLDEKLEQCLEQGLEQGRVQGKLSMLLELYADGTISLADAVKNSNMSEEEFLAFAKGKLRTPNPLQKAPGESPGLFLYTKETCGSVSASVAPHFGRDYCPMLSIPISTMVLCFHILLLQSIPLKKRSDFCKDRTNNEETQAR